MLAIRVLCVGKLKERFYTEAAAEYEKRLGPFCKLELIELQEERLGERPSQAEIDAALQRESERIERKFLKDASLIALCVEGKQLSSEEVSELLTRTEGSGRSRMNLVIGGSFGLAPDIKARADLRLSMSKMTFPHHLARVMLLEQIYRGFQIRDGSRYHK